MDLHEETNLIKNNKVSVLAQRPITRHLTLITRRTSNVPQKSSDMWKNFTHRETKVKQTRSKEVSHAPPLPGLALSWRHKLKFHSFLFPALTPCRLCRLVRAASRSFNSKNTEINWKNIHSVKRSMQPQARYAVKLRDFIFDKCNLQPAHFRT